MHAEYDRKYQAGDWIDDRCRPCGEARRHTVVVAEEGTPVRVLCDTCGSQHNYRGGESGEGSAPRPAHAPAPPPAPELPENLEGLLRRVIREESGFTPCRPSDKWVGGTLILKPGKEGLQEKSMPIDTFFSKVVMVRNRLRSLEQQVNASDLPPDVKAKVQGYVSGCYGSLTSFNVLFSDDGDRFSSKG